MVEDNGFLYVNDKGGKTMVHKAGVYMHNKLLLLTIVTSL